MKILVANLWRAFCFASLAVFVFFTLMVLCGSARAATDGQKFSMTFDRLQVQQLVMIFYDQCEKRGLLFDPSLNKLDEVLTFKTPLQTCMQARQLVIEALTRSGIQITTKGSYDVIERLQARDERDGWRELIYRPRFRDAIELAEQVGIAIRKGSFAHQRKLQVQVQDSAQNVPETGSNGASLAGKQVDKLIFFGPSSECDAIQSLFARIDLPTPQVEILAGIYEYQSGKTSGSALNAAVSLLNAQLGLSITTPATSGASLRLSIPNLDAVFSVLDQDTRFHFVSRPKVLAMDGEPVRFFAGEDVRVVGSVVLDRNGNPIQSKETLSAGVTLEATPHIRGDVVDLNLYQAISNFSAGVGGDPSILKRDLRSRLLMQPGVVYVIGGLQSARKTKGKSSFFGFQVGNQAEVSETEVLILISVQKQALPI